MGADTSIVSGVVIRGSAGSRNRGPRPLGAPTVVIIYFICKTQNNQDSEETEIRSLAFSKSLGLLTAFIFFASGPSTNDVTLFWPIFDPLPLVTKGQTPSNMKSQIFLPP